MLQMVSLPNIWMFELSKCHFGKISLLNYYVECLVSAQSATHLIKKTIHIYIICLGKPSGKNPKPTLLGLFGGIWDHHFSEGWWPNRVILVTFKWRSKTLISTSPPKKLCPKVVSSSRHKAPCFFWGNVALRGVRPQEFPWSKVLMGFIGWNS